MKRRALFRLGLRGLLLHKLRSTLSILGVVFGVAAVVAMSSVGEGARREALEQLGALGMDSVTLRARRPSSASAPGPGALRLRDAESLARVVPHVVATAPVREADLSAEAGGRRADAVAVGTTPDYVLAARLGIAAGRFLTPLDLRDQKRVAVLGASVAAALFPFGPACGERILLGGDWFQVVGVLHGRSSARGRTTAIRTRDVNRAVFVPLPALDRGADPRPDGVDEIVMRVDDPRQVTAVAEAAKALVERGSGGVPFDVVVPREILRARERTQRIFNVVTGAIAAISLLVGGIGIMNIMLASVAERTREVGIRRALGATQRDVAAQFLAESSLLTAAGGVLGALLGAAGAALIQQLAGWPTALSPLMLALALLTAIAVGVGFGSYPAWLAARLAPMDALRHE
ncbi:MAG: ABC transporter permease [Acidobacteria bacterium]|nr:MAG: ABC transporter permease [Acidobacteriota bacterium]